MENYKQNIYFKRTNNDNNLFIKQYKSNSNINFKNENFDLYSFDSSIYNNFDNYENSNFNLINDNEIYNKNKILSKSFILKENKNFSKKFSEIMEKYKYSPINENKENNNLKDISYLFQKKFRKKYKLEKQKMLNFLKNKNKSSENLFNKLYNNVNNKSINIISNLKEDLINDQKENNNNSNENNNDSKNLINSKIKVDFFNPNFKNSIQSFNTILKNKIIYEDMMINFQKKLYNNYSFQIQRHNYLKKFFSNDNNNKLPKIKITTKINKNNDLSWLENNFTNSLNKKKIKNISILSYIYFNQNSKNNPNLNKNEKKIEFNNFYLFSYYIYPQKNFPESREEFVFTQNETNDILLFGGFASNKSNILWKFLPNLKSFKIEKISNNINCRSCHTGIIHHHKFIIFGGKLYNSNIFGDIEIYNMDNKMWYSPNLKTFNKLKLRRNHIGVSIGNQMFIHGGIDEDDNYLKDCYLLNYSPLKWQNIITSEYIPQLAFHKCCLVLPKSIRKNKYLNIYKIPEENNLNTINIMNKIKIKGLYIFGGKINENNINKDLICMLLKKPVEFIKITTNGIGPIPRYNSSINYYEEGNFIIIHGGRNDDKSDNYALNDTFLLELFTLNWLKVEYYNDINNLIVNRRYCHESIIFDNKLYIFGGMDSNNILKSEMFIIELDSNNRILMKKQENAFDKIIKKFKSKNKM